MAALAEGLPVAPVPKKSFVPSVRDDVIHDRGFGVPAVPRTLRTQRMTLQI